MSNTGGSSLTHHEGSQAGVSRPEKEWDKLESRMKNEERTIIIDKRFHGAIIGTRGVNIKEITSTFNKVRISFPERG
ncbi:vigilin [Cherax quadricarinatus]|uniref:vigilin n=1 Tax=Cherax quadricarinatus TaxID=27406 RepID=UPI00387E7526